MSEFGWLGKIVGGVAGIAAWLGAIAPAPASPVLERALATGVLEVGAREDAAPFGYRTTDGEWTGYSVELLHLLRDRLEQRLGRSLQLRLHAVSVEDRFDRVRAGTLAVVCGATTITADRLQTVDFSIPFFVTGTRFLVPVGSEFEVGSTLAGRAIAYIPGTTTDQMIRQIYPRARWQPVATRAEGMDRLRLGRIDAIASDGILLTGEMRLHEATGYALVPAQPMTTELYGCILPKRDAAWKEVVDRAIASDANRALQDKWFDPERGRFPYPWRVGRYAETGR